jgi:hypothetical protein
VRFIDLKEYPAFFQHVSYAFLPTAAASKEDSLMYMGMGSRSKLEVQKVGSYDASYVPTVADFSRLDERFRLPDGTWEKLPAYKDWGFAVFKLRDGDQQYHPMAFAFDRKSDAALFFPTVHIHDGKVHSNANFDHILYCQPGEPGLALNGWKESFGPASTFVNVEKARGVVDGTRHFYRYEIKARRPNRDIYVIKA